MDFGYQQLKDGMKELAVLQNSQFLNASLLGKRSFLPLKDREIGVVFYPGAPEDPVLFCCYGGGFIMGSAANDDACWADVQKKLSVNLFSINYRKAPDHPFPQPLEDVYDSIEYLEAHLDDYGVTSRDFSVFGFSAGGNLAASVCLLDQQRGGRLNIRRQILNYPYLDLATSPKVKGHVESERMIYTLFPEYYCQDHDPAERMISPVYSTEEDLKGLPRAIILMADRDPLHGEDARYACKLRAAGVQVDSFVAPLMGHGYFETAYQQPGPYMSPETEALLKDGTIRRETDRTIEFIKAHF